MSTVTMIQLTPQELSKLVSTAVKEALNGSHLAGQEEMTLTEVASYLGVSTRTVRRMELRGEIPPRLGRLWRRSDIEKHRADRRI